MTAADRVTVIGVTLTAVDFHGEAAIDAVLSMVAVACCAEGLTRFRGVGNLRWKESDRIGDLARELRKLGVEVTEHDDGLTVKGQPSGYEGGLEINTYQDHRMIMTFAVLALRTRRGLVLNGAEHVRKSYPDFFTDLASLGARVESRAD